MAVSNFEAMASVAFLIITLVALLIMLAIATHKEKKRNAELKEIADRFPEIREYWNGAKTARVELLDCRNRKAELKTVIDELRYCPENSACSKKLLTMKHKFLDECLKEKHLAAELKQYKTAIYNYEIEHFGEQKDIYWNNFI